MVQADSSAQAFPKLVAAIAAFQEVLVWDSTGDSKFFNGISVNIVDVQLHFILIGAAGLGVAAKRCGIKLDKSYSCYGWSFWPLECFAVNYSACDAEVLFQLQDYARNNNLQLAVRDPNKVYPEKHLLNFFKPVFAIHPLYSPFDDEFEDDEAEERPSLQDFVRPEDDSSEGDDHGFVDEYSSSEETSICNETDSIVYQAVAVETEIPVPVIDEEDAWNWLRSLILKKLFTITSVEWPI